MRADRTTSCGVLAAQTYSSTRSLTAQARAPFAPQAAIRSAYSSARPSRTKSAVTSSSRAASAQSLRPSRRMQPVSRRALPSSRARMARTAGLAVLDRTGSSISDPPFSYDKGPDAWSDPLFLRKSA